jgi:hypothetical protein
MISGRNIMRSAEGWEDIDMTNAVFMLLPLVTMALGLFLVFKIIRGGRRTVFIGLHILSGFVSLEMAVILLKGWPVGDAVPAGEYGNFAVAALAFAGFAGLVRPILAKGSKPLSYALLAIHLGAGLTGVALCMTWLSSL